MWILLVLSGLVFSLLSQEIFWVELFRNDIFFVEWDVVPCSLLAMWLLPAFESCFCLLQWLAHGQWSTPQAQWSRAATVTPVSTMNWMEWYLYTEDITPCLPQLTYLPMRSMSSIQTLPRGTSFAAFLSTCVDRDVISFHYYASQCFQCFVLCWLGGRIKQTYRKIMHTQNHITANDDTTPEWCGLDAVCWWAYEQQRSAQTAFDSAGSPAHHTAANCTSPGDMR